MNLCAADLFITRDGRARLSAVLAALHLLNPEILAYLPFCHAASRSSDCGLSVAVAHRVVLPTANSRGSAIPPSSIGTATSISGAAGGGKTRRLNVGSWS